MSVFVGKVKVSGNEARKQKEIKQMETTSLNGQTTGLRAYREQLNRKAQSYKRQMEATTDKDFAKELEAKLIDTLDVLYQLSKKMSDDEIRRENQINRLTIKLRRYENLPAEDKSVAIKCAIKAYREELKYWVEKEEVI